MTTITTKYPFVGNVETKQGGRNENQDNAGFVDTSLGLLVVVCDGMGGGPGGKTASLMAVDKILNHLLDILEHTSRVEALKYAIEKANDALYSKAKATPELRGMGTTVAAILLNEDSAVIAHAGDTRIYQLRKGTVVFRSSDHSVVANYVRQNKLTEEEARNHPQSNIVTRALGIRPTIEIDFDEVTFLRGDRFVICTDGIWGMMPQQNLVKSLSRVMGISELTSLLAKEIDNIGNQNGGGHDNLTLAIIDTTFDSTKRKIKSKHVTETGADTVEGEYPKSKKKNKTLMVIFTCILSIIYILLCHYSFFQDRADEEFIPQKNGKGEITTTVGNHPIIKETSDSLSPESEMIDQQAVMFPPKEGENPFQNSNVREEQKKITRLVNNVNRNLDSLKKINGRNRKEAQNIKIRFIRHFIEPDISHLRKSVVEEKKEDIDRIITMLKDKKTMSTTKQGRTTRESENHIESIRSKIKSLQD